LSFSHICRYETRQIAARPTTAIDYPSVVKTPPKAFDETIEMDYRNNTYKKAIITYMQSQGQDPPLHPIV
jgi:hypothetical protein